MNRKSLGILLLLCLTGCAPTVSQRLRACLDARYSDAHSLTDCEATALESRNPNDPLARIMRANDRLYDAKLGLLMRQRRRIEKEGSAPMNMRRRGAHWLMVMVVRTFT
jgi:hypothetical protein